MAVQGPFKKYFSLQNWILKFQKWQKVGGALFLLLPGMRVQKKISDRSENVRALIPLRELSKTDEKVDVPARDHDELDATSWWNFGFFTTVQHQGNLHSAYFPLPIASAASRDPRHVLIFLRRPQQSWI